VTVHYYRPTQLRLQKGFKMNEKTYAKINIRSKKRSQLEETNFTQNLHGEASL